MAPHHSRQLAEQLSRNSHPYRDPLARIDWQGLAPDRAWLPESALSLYGIPEFMDAEESLRLALSKAEFLHLITCHDTLNSLLVRRLTQETTHACSASPDMQYRLHELRETIGQRLLHKELLHLQSATYRPSPPARIPMTRALLLHGSENRLGYWLVRFLIKDIVDRVYRYIRHHADPIADTVRDIAGMHNIELSRHSSYVRDHLAEMATHPSLIQGRLWPWMSQRLLREITFMFCLPPASLYTRNGYRPGHIWHQRARINPEHRAFMDLLIQPTRHILSEYRLHD